GDIVFDSLTIPENSYLRFGIALTASGTNSGIAFTGIRVYKPVSEVISVTGVTLNKSTSSLYVGDTEQLTATVAPTNATDKSVSWSTLNNLVATVDSFGLVTAIGAGEATIRVTTTDGSFTADCVFTVSNVLVTGVTLDKTEVELFIEQTNQLTATIAPTNATDKSVTWSSSDETKVTVSTAGLLTAVAPTSSPVTVTVTTTDGGFTDSVLVTVIEDLFVLVNSSTFNGTGSANWPTATGMGAYYINGYGVASASAGATVKAPLLLKDIVVGSQVRVEIASVTNSTTNTTNVSVYGLDYMGERISGISGSYTNPNNGGGTVNLDTLTARALANEGVIVLPVSLTTKIYGVEVVFESADSRSLLAQIEVFSLAASDADQAAAFANLVNSDVGAGANGSCPAILAVLQNDYSLLSVGAKAVVDSSTDAAFVSARARIAYLEAWVTANPGATANPLDLSSNTPITLIIGILGLTAVAGFYLVSKKRYNN
ncbi:MAG: Ig-like domain-containing protein, partial [Acholeplasmataceae bacterium]